MTESNDGYVEAFYEIAAIMGIPAQNKSPKEVFDTQMLPRLKEAFAGRALLDALKEEGEGCEA